MAKRTNKLSARTAATSRKMGRHSDGNGLYLQVTRNASGSITRSWLFRFMLDGKARAMGLGSADVVPLVEAREAARQAKLQVMAGDDPIAVRLETKQAKARERRERVTLREAAKRYVEVHRPTWTAKYARELEGQLERFAFPSLGDLEMRALVDPEVNHALAKLFAKAPNTAGKVKSHVSSIRKWIESGRPAPAAAREKRHHPALAWQESPTFVKDLRAGKRTIGRMALELLILTSARSNEARSMRWEEIDLYAKTWTVPASRMKGRRPHVVPLSDAALAVLREARKVRSRGLVFASPRGGALGGSALREIIGTMHITKFKRDGIGWIDVKERGERIDAHGMRSCFRTWAQETTAYPEEMLKVAQAHKVQDATAEAYARGSMLERRRALMQDWANYLARPADDAKVVPLRGAVMGVRLG